MRLAFPLCWIRMRNMAKFTHRESRCCGLVVNMTRQRFSIYARTLAGSYAIGEYIDDEAMDYLQLMHTDIYYEYSLAMTSKTWALKNELDTMIMRVVQSGIQSMWEWQVGGRRFGRIPSGCISHINHRSWPSTRTMRCRNAWPHRVRSTRWTADRSR